MKRSYGTGLSDVSVMHHYKRSLVNPRVRELLTVADFTHLQQIVDLASRLERQMGKDNKSMGRGETVRRTPVTSAPRDRPIRKCYNCGSPGHISTKCPKPKRKEVKPRVKVNEVEGEGEETENEEGEVAEVED